MAIKNLYAVLSVSPLSDAAKIQAVLKEAAQAGKIELEDAQLVKQFLLDAETRKKYDAKLFAEQPEILKAAIAAKRAVPPPRRMIFQRKTTFLRHQTTHLEYQMTPIRPTNQKKALKNVAVQISLH